MKLSKGHRRRIANIPEWVPSEPPTPCDSSLRYYERVTRRYEETLQAVESELEDACQERDGALETEKQAQAERDAARAENASLKALLLEARDYIADETGGAYADDLEFAAKIDAALGPADG